MEKTKTMSDGDFTRIWALAMTLLTPEEIACDPAQMDHKVRQAFSIAIPRYMQFKAELIDNPIRLESAEGTPAEIGMTKDFDLTLTLRL